MFAFAVCTPIVLPFKQINMIFCLVADAHSAIVEKFKFDFGTKEKQTCQTDVFEYFVCTGST